MREMYHFGWTSGAFQANIVKCIEIGIDLELSEHHFDQQAVILSTSTPTNALQQYEKMSECIDFYTIRCDEDELYVNVDILVNASEFLKSMFLFRSASKQDDWVIDLQCFRKERMIDAREIL